MKKLMSCLVAVLQAAAVFTGDARELKSNPLYQDQQISIIQP